MSHHLLSSSLVLCSDLGTSHRHRLVNFAKNKFVSAHAEPYESFVLHPVILHAPCSAGFSSYVEPCEFLFGLSRALGAVRISVRVVRALGAVRISE